MKFTATFATILTTLVFLANLNAASAQNIKLKTINSDNRVVIFDASGSMVNRDFNTPDKSRIDVAHELLSAVYGQILENSDPIPTATLAFGSRYNYKNQKARNRWTGQSDPRTLNHPICDDSIVHLPFQKVDRKLVRSLDQMQDLKPIGMTPIHRSLLQGLKAFRGDISGKSLQFILISDLETPNCLPKGQDICDQLLPEIDRVEAAGASVEALVFETPLAGILDLLSNCMKTISISVPPTRPDIPKIVKEALDLLNIVPQFVASGSNNLDPNGVNPATARLKFAPKGKNVVLASGPSGTFKLPKGEFEVTGSIDQASISTIAQISKSGPLVLNVAPGTLIVSAKGGSGAAPALFEELVISRPSGAKVATVQNYKPGNPLSLANGSYNVKATVAGGVIEGSVSLELGTTKDLVLDFGRSPLAQTNDRDLRVNLRLHAPSLDVPGLWPPAIILKGPGQTMPLSASGFAGKVSPGSFAVEIQSSSPHELRFEVAASQKPYEVQLEVAAGWFTADSPTGASVSFELRDQSNKALFRFESKSVKHSLPEGEYILVLLSPDGNHKEQSFSIRIGKGSKIVFS